MANRHPSLVAFLQRVSPHVGVSHKPGDFYLQIDFEESGLMVFRVVIEGPYVVFKDGVLRICEIPLDDANDSNPFAYNYVCQCVNRHCRQSMPFTPPEPTPTWCVLPADFPALEAMSAPPAASVRPTTRPPVRPPVQPAHFGVYPSET